MRGAYCDFQTGRGLPMRKRVGHNQATTIAKKLDKLLQAANGNARRVISRKTIASLLRLIISGKLLVWARSQQVTSGLNYTSATVALCARINPSTLLIAIKSAPAYKSSPGRAWSELTPWQPQNQSTRKKLKHWLNVRSADRVRVSISIGALVASELLKLPPAKIKWHIGLLSDRSEIFVVQDLLDRKHKRVPHARTMSEADSAVEVVGPPATAAKNAGTKKLFKSPTEQKSPGVPIGPQYAGFSERLMYHSLDSDLRAGRMSTILNGEVISEADARRMVAHARAQGWIK